jgi:hypothetical protein
MAAKSTTKKKTSAAAKAKAAPAKTKAAAKPAARAKSQAKKSPKSLDDHTLLTQTLVFIFAMLSIIFVAMAAYWYS